MEDEKLEVQNVFDNYKSNDKDDIPIDVKRNVFMFFEKRDIPLVLLGSFIMCASAVCTPMSTLLYGKALGNLALFYAGEQELGDFLNETRILCGAVMGVGGAKMLLVWLGVTVFMRFGEIQQSRARAVLFDKILKEEAKWYDQKKNLMGNLAQVNRCIEELRQGTSEVIAMAVQSLALIISLVAMSFYQTWAVTLIVMATSPVMALSGWWFGRLTYKGAEEENETTSKGSKLLDWCLVSPALVRVFNGKYTEMARFNEIIDKSAKAYCKLANAIAANSGMLKFLTLMMFVQAFWFGNHLLTTGKVNIEQLMTCFSSCLMLGSTIAQTTELLAALNAAHAAAGKISTFLDLDAVYEDYDESQASSPYMEKFQMHPPTCYGAINFNNVSFKYPSRNEVILNNVSFSLQPQRMNFIIGKSGAGKSTIPLILMNLYDIESGSIEIDGRSLRHFESGWLTHNITLVQQNPVVFNASIRDNIALAVSEDYESLGEVPETLIHQAAEFALLEDLIDAKGIDSMVTQSSLSGGQQQRLAFARAKMRDCPVLILDEAFSALDAKNRDKLYENTKRWRNGKTTIVITHEFSNIEPDDHVVVLQAGQVVSEGDFKHIQQQPIFKEFDFKAVDKISQKEKSMVQRRSIYYNYKTNPYILKDLEMLSIKAKDKEEDIMGVLSILKYCRSSIQQKWLIGLGILISIMDGAANPVFAMCFAKLLATSVEAAIGNDVEKEVIKWSIVACCIATFSGATSYVADFVLAYSSEKWIVALRKLSFERINNQDMSFFDSEETKPAELTALLMNDARDLRSLISDFLKVGLNLIFMVLVGIIWSIVTGWKLALVGLSFVPLIFVLTGIYGSVMESAENKYKTRVAKLENHLHETVTAIKTIKIFNMSNHFQKTFYSNLDEIQKVGSMRAIRTAVGVAMNDMLVAVATGTILYFGLKLTGELEYTVGSFMQILTLLMFAMSSAGALLGQLPGITRGQRAGTFIVKLLENTPYSKVENDGDARPTSIPETCIKFNHTRFSYPLRPQDPILVDASFEIRRNELVGIVGESGSGKSTIVALLCRLYGSNPGQVTLCNNDISSLDPDWLKEKVSLVPQFPKFFEGSIYDNLVYGISPLLQITHTDVLEVLEMVGILEFVVTLPEGLQTPIGEGSNSLVSGGQLQRLSIARALLRRPKVLIFDECTSNLDPVNTRVVIDMIRNKLAKKYTILLITHDREMMKITDKLIVLKNGRVGETGTYEQLIGLNGELARITKSAM
ncbi:HST6 [[Candida] subhashii]|uniref:HST6 n=1 Tax=[Candida] subhashii TaxID=561895 RepID=A0A8J5V133_9ASCO|nr:HST6 [[Candida] subhashii]KAG7665750.1 HST6 [[Candida] subhashii]